MHGFSYAPLFHAREPFSVSVSRFFFQVAKALASTPAIRKVQLNSNEIGTSGALAVARSVQDKKDLQASGVNHGA